MPAVIYLILAIISSASMTIVLKLFRNQTGNRYGLILGNYLTCTALSVCFLPSGTSLQLDSATLICGLIAGVLFVAGLVSMQSSIQRNGAILTSVFSKSGLLVPLLISLLFLHEALTILQVAGVLLIFIAIWLITMDRSPMGENAASVSPVLLILVLLSHGSADAMAKIYEYQDSAASDGLYFLILFSTASILTIGLLLYDLRVHGRRLRWREFLMGILAGIPNYFSSYLLLQALKALPASLVYPSYSTGALLLISLVGILAFREHPGRRKWIGLVITAVALVLLSV